MIASLRTRLLAGIMGAMLLLLATFSLIIYGAIRSALWTQFDARLASTAHLLAASIEQDANEIEVGLSIQQLPEFRDTRHAARYQLWREDGTVVAKSPLLHQDDLSPAATGLNSPVFADWHGKDGRPQRVVTLRFLPQPADREEGSARQQTKVQTLCLTVAWNTTELHRQLRLLCRLLWTASGAVLALSFLVGSAVVRRGLVPLHLLAAQIATIRADDLTVRVGVEGTPQEMVPIKERLNDLLARLEASFQRERRFAADAAHELRTPLAGIRATVEVALARARAGDEYRVVLRECLEIVQRMQTLVNSLLLLARLDALQVTFRREHIPFADLVCSCWRPFSERAVARRITFACSIPEDLTCVGDPDCLSMIVSNLLDNAAEYTNDGGQIQVAAHRASRHVELTIANTGCSLTEAQVAQVFDCFWRGDPARKNGGLHCGLGLALVQRLANALGDSITAQLQAGGMFTVRMILDDNPAGFSS